MSGEMARQVVASFKSSRGRKLTFGVTNVRVRHTNGVAKHRRHGRKGERGEPTGRPSKTK